MSEHFLNAVCHLDYEINPHHVEYEGDKDIHIGIFGFDIVGAIFGGQDAVFSRIIFTIVGLCALWCISFYFKDGSVSGKKKRGSA